jgi:GTP-dependent dephospho-CoA kinase
MTLEYRLTPALRIKLKEPFGTLIEGTPEQTMAKMKQLVLKRQPPRVVSVGDVVSRNMHQHGIHPQLTIIDNISLRDQKMPKEAPVEKTIRVQNPAGGLTVQAEEAVKEALAGNVHTHLVVEGEEDLLVLAAVKYAPLGALVVYGQPRLGIVVVEASAKKKAEVEGFLNEMKASKS